MYSLPLNFINDAISTEHIESIEPSQKLVCSTELRESVRVCVITNHCPQDGVTHLDLLIIFYSIFLNLHCSVHNSSQDPKLRLGYSCLVELFIVLVETLYTAAGSLPEPRVSSETEMCILVFFFVMNFYIECFMIVVPSANNISILLCKYKYYTIY